MKRDDSQLCEGVSARTGLPCHLPPLRGKRLCMWHSDERQTAYAVARESAIPSAYDDQDEAEILRYCVRALYELERSGEYARQRSRVLMLKDLARVAKQAIDSRAPQRVAQIDAAQREQMGIVSTRALEQRAGRTRDANRAVARRSGRRVRCAAR